MKTNKLQLLVFAVLSAYHIKAQVAITTDGSTAHSSAMLEVKSTTKGFLPPRMTQAEREAISSPANGLIVHQTDGTSGIYQYNGTAWNAISLSPGTQTGQMQYWNGTAWVLIAPDAYNGATLKLIGGIPTWVGGTPPPTEVTNPTTGKIWMDRNLGASQAATSITDAEAFGDLYQWGRGSDGHQLRTSSTTSQLCSNDNPGHGNFITTDTDPYDWRSPQKDNLWQGVNGINNPCPTGFRIPTYAEWEAECVSWVSNNAAGAFASSLKLPLAGFRQNVDGIIVNQTNSVACYWSSDVIISKTWFLYLTNNSSFMAYNNRAYGFSVRCIKN